MAIPHVAHDLSLVSVLSQVPHRVLWTSYDTEADVLYLNFTQPSRATDSELTDNGFIVRFDGDEVIGYTILHARQRYGP